MVLSRSLVSGAVLGALAMVGACTVNAGSGQGATQSPAGTTPIATSQARAFVTGTVASSLTGGPLQMSVNDQPQTVDVAPDGTFEVRDVPTGDVKLGCQAGGVTGTSAISAVQPGEIIQVSIAQQGGAIAIVVVQRTQATEPPAQVTQADGDALVIQGSHLCYWLNPGHYTRDIVVKGDDVHLFGAAHQSCVIDDYTILDGKLELDGQGDSVLDVEVDGQLVVNGSHCAIQDSCTRCFDQDCGHACGSDDQKGRVCGPVQPSQPDAGASEPDAEAQDCGATFDAGVELDAAPSGDSAIAPDGAGAEQDAGPGAQQDASVVVIDAGVGPSEASSTPSGMLRRR
jgi:hypothetical protein